MAAVLVRHHVHCSNALISALRIKDWGGICGEPWARIQNSSLLGKNFYWLARRYWWVLQLIRLICYIRTSHAFHKGAKISNRIISSVSLSSFIFCFRLHHLVKSVLIVSLNNKRTTNSFLTSFHNIFISPINFYDGYNETESQSVCSHIPLFALFIIIPFGHI